MTEESKVLGEKLKRRREEQKLSLKEVENATSIRQLFLEAIEEGSITDQVSGIYAEGFLKQYAIFLGFKIDHLMKEHAIAFRMPPAKHNFTYGIGTLEMRNGPSRRSRWLPNILWVTLTAVILGLAWYLAKFLGVM